MVCFEAFAITNFLMNMLVLGLSARGFRHVKRKRMLAAAIIGTVYAAAAYVCLPYSIGPAVQVIGLLLMAFMMYRENGRWLRGCFRIAGSTLFAGGVMSLIGQRFAQSGWLMLAVGLPATTAVVFLLETSSSGTNQTDALLRICISTGMGRTEVEALIDTGNRLRDPVSGLPVLIVGMKCLRGILDEACLNAASRRRLPLDFRLIHYGVLGGNGEMACFKPESVCVWRKGGWSELPDVWVGIYPGNLPSGLEAIAPPVFAQHCN